MEYGPKATSADLSSLYGLLNSYKNLSESTALSDALFGDKSLYSWGKGIETGIQSEKTRQAKEYLKKMRESDVTKAIAADQDILDSFAGANPYFFDRYSDAVQTAKNEKLAAESASSLNRVKEEAIRRANESNLRGGDEVAIADSLGLRNRTDTEREAYRNAVTDAWKERTLPMLLQAATDQYYADPSALDDFIKNRLAQDNIVLNASDYTTDEALSPYRKNTANNAIKMMLEDNGKAESMQDINNYQQTLDIYGADADTALLDRASQFRQHQKDQLFTERYNKLAQELNAMSDEDLKNMGVSRDSDYAELMEKYYIPYMAEDLGITPQEVYEWATGVNRVMNDFNATSHRLAALEADVTQGNFTLDNLKGNIDDAYSGIGTALLNDSELDSPNKAEYDKFTSSDAGKQYMNSSILIPDKVLRENINKLQVNRKADVVLNIVHVLKKNHPALSYQDIYDRLSKPGSIVNEAKTISEQLLTLSKQQKKVNKSKQTLEQGRARANALTGRGIYR